MADASAVEAELNALPPQLKAIFIRVFRAFLKDIRFGHPLGEATDPMLNMSGGFLHGTTPTLPGDEFTIAHGFGRAPYWAVAGLRLDTVGSSIVPLTVSRAADNKRIYLTSTIGDAPISLAVEG